MTGCIEDVVSREAIRELKHCYCRAIDTKDWTLLEALCTSDCSFSYADGERSYASPAELIAFNRSVLGRPSMVSMHLAAQSEIDLHDESTASGRWAFYAVVHDMEGGTTTNQFAFYEDRYARVEEAWKIRESNYRRVFSSHGPTPDSLTITPGGLLG